MDHGSWDELVEEGPLKVVCNEPAKHWTNALPFGNGRLGAMVWGGFASELIQLNAKEPKDTLWTGSPGDYTDPKVQKTLRSSGTRLTRPNMQKLLQASAANLMGKPSEVYRLLGDLVLDFGDR